MNAALKYLIDIAPKFLSMPQPLFLSESTVLLKFNLLLADGREIYYEILVEAVGQALTAKEYTTRNLPSFCPDRHINYDGSFCMYWEGDTQFTIRDEQDAIAWFETLLQFLKLQVRAEKKKAWPNDDYWSHGDAAKYQQLCYQAAQGISEDFVQYLKNKTITTKYCKARNKQGDFIKVYLYQKHFYTIWVDHKKTAALKSKCFCKSGKKLKKCLNHAELSFKFAESLENWKKAEDEFWHWIKQKKDVVCCGTLKNCPLKI